MKKCWKKPIALALAVCCLLGLCLPAAPTAFAENTAEFGEPVALGKILRSDYNTPGQLEITQRGGREYLVAPIKGKQLYIFSLTDYLEGKANADGNYIYAQVETDINVPRGLAEDSAGIFYAVGDSSNVCWYNMDTGASGKISTGASGLGAICIDENDNIYVSGKAGTTGVIYKIDATTKKATEFYRSSDFTMLQAIDCGDGKVYTYGATVKSVSTGGQIRMLSDDGVELARYSLPNTTSSYHVSYMGGVVFLGLNVVTATNDGFVALDTSNDGLTLIDMGLTAPILGIVSEPINGKAYMCVQEDGIYEYNVDSKTLGTKVNSAGRRGIRPRNPYIHFEGNTYLLSVGPNSVATTSSAVNGGSVSLTGLLKDAYATFTPRCITPGVEGTGVAVYAGAYLSNAVASYSPDGDPAVTPVAFSNGHAQTDSMIAYKGKIYGGAYSGAYLFEYDPVTGDVRELISGLKDNYQQLRIHSLAVGDDKIFFSTIPTDQQLGGCIGWYDLKTDTYYCERNVIQDQATITLAYDEARDILFGGTTIRGGTNSSATAEQAALFAYDVNSKKLLASTTVDSLTGDKPRYVSGIAQDPNTGKLWGQVGHVVFSFAYENGSLSLTKEWEAAKKPSNLYPDGESKSWFPRPIVFDKYGNMYIGFLLSEYGIMRFTMGSDGSIKNAVSACDATTRVYTIGTDGNLYYYSDELYQVELLDQDSECVIESADHIAYVTLTEALYNATSADTVTLLKDIQQDICVTGGATLDLNGKKVTGDVNVIYGKLVDTAGQAEITGTVSVPADNPSMPLLVPNTENTYRLFDYTPVNTSTPKADDTVAGAMNYWFDLEFADDEAYTLLKGNSNLKVGATLSWKEANSIKSVKVSFDQILSDWAGADHSSNQGLYVQVTNIPAEGVSEITVTPYFEAVGTGLKITMDSIVRSDAKISANAIFGAYPTGLIIG